MELAKQLLQEARNNIEEAIEIIKEEKPLEFELHEYLRQEKIIIGSKIAEIDLM